MLPKLGGGCSEGGEGIDGLLEVLCSDAVFAGMEQAAPGSLQQLQALVQAGIPMVRPAGQPGASSIPDGASASLSSGLTFFRRPESDS